MNFHAFNRAIVRTPSRSVVEGLRAVDFGAPSYDGVIAEHRDYVRVLESLGVSVETLPALEAFPDSVFVEDTALVFTGAAILLRPGAATRRGEAAEMAATLNRNFARMLHLEDGTAEGGDVLTTPRGVFIGASARTSVAGATALVALLAQIGQQGFVVNTPRGVLHLKSDCSLLDDETILCTSCLAAAEPFPGFRLILTPPGEEGAANALRIGDSVLLSKGYPKTAEVLARASYNVKPLATAEIAKIDAGLSCMSLRWRA
ncbi:MAG: dimethylarginine dimethylaminohydrolase [Caulobacteraceae bacterium]|nr:dimethylarginine dimethylaminohydrolase [Caulobacteraceae bacterium]